MKHPTKQSYIAGLRRIPLTLRLAFIFSVPWLIGFALGLPPNMPQWGNSLALSLHFFGPIAIAMILQFLLTLIYLLHRNKASRKDGAFTMVALFPLLVLSVFLQFNYKAWTPLVNPALYDEPLYRFDLWAAPVVQLFKAIRTWLATFSPGIDLWYGLLYMLMFFLSFGIHTIIDPPQLQRRFVISLCLNLVVGGLSYWPLPALGPFIYEPGLSPGATRVQLGMLEAYNVVRETGQLPYGYFTAALGAMPSLHVGHSLLFVLWAFYRARPLLLLYLPIFVFINIEAICTGYHYLLDLPAGALLAIFSFTVSGWLMRQEEAARQPVAPIITEGLSQETA